MEVNREAIEEIISTKEVIRGEIEDGVKQYAAIFRMYSDKQIQSDCFKKTFCRFYRVRGRIDRGEIFRILADKDNLSYSDILSRLSLGNTVVNISFASKILHTRNNSEPIYDSVIAKFYHIRRKERGYGARFKEAVKIYVDLQNIYKDKDNNNLKRLSEAFDKIFPSYDFSVEKKIDFMIWGWGKWKRFNEKYPLPNDQP